MDEIMEQSFLMTEHHRAGSMAAGLSEREAIQPLAPGITFNAELPVEVWERILIYMPASAVYKMSLVSRRLREITSSDFFRARYFMGRYMRCQAIYYASCYPKLFTESLLLSLLSLGAILSRYFVQSIFQRNLGIGRRGNQRWAQHIASPMMTAVLNEGVKLYGESFKYSISSTDGTALRQWGEGAFRGNLNDDIREIFEVGRFTPYSSSDDNVFYNFYILADAIARFPELMQMLVSNGYEFSPSDQERIVKSMLESACHEDEEKLYSSFDKLLKDFPHWRLNGMAYSADWSFGFLRQPFSRDYSPVPIDEDGYALLVKHDGIGPVSARFKVAKRLYDEGRGFMDMAEAVKRVVTTHIPVDECAITMRILTHYFPKEMTPFKKKTAIALIRRFQQDIKGAAPTFVTRGHEMILRLFSEMGLDTGDLIEVFTDERFSYNKLLLYAINAGAFGPKEEINREEFLDSLLCTCLSNPMKGNKLEEIEDAVRELFTGGVPKRYRAAQKLLVDSLTAALMQWQFDISLLKPDRRNVVEHKLRTPIAWMVKGAYNVSGHRSYSPLYTQLPDIHGLFPPGRPRHVNDTITLTFANTQLSARETPKQEKQSTIVTTMVSRQQSSQGVQPIGRAEQVGSQADDSGVFMTDETGERDEIGATTAASQEGGLAAPSQSSNVMVPVRNRRPSCPGRPLGNFPSFTLRVLKSHCGKCWNGEQSANCCSISPPFDSKAKETATVIRQLLHPSSPALRDVVLSHALVNGNEEMATALMSGPYSAQSVSAETEDKKPLQRLVLTSRFRAGQPDMPVLPTLAHLRILQAVERKPMSTLAERIIDGAPFKRGYVMSKLPTREKETDYELREKWYMKKGHKDDGPLIALFAEKDRLIEVDRALRKKARTRKKGKKRASRDASDDGEGNSFGPGPSTGSSTNNILGDSSHSNGAVSESRPSGRQQPTRSTRKPVRYVDDVTFTDEELTDDEDGEEEINAVVSYHKAAQSTSKKATKGTVVKQAAEVKATVEKSSLAMASGGTAISHADIFGGGESELSSDDQMQSAEEPDTDDDDENDECDENEETGEGDSGELVTILFSHRGSLSNASESMTVPTLKRRIKSISLWLSHLELLRWFEERKEKAAREKAKKARSNQMPAERVTKTAFHHGLNDMIRIVERASIEMQIKFHMEIMARRSLAQQRHNAPKGSKATDTQTNSTTKNEQIKAGTAHHSSKKRKRKESETSVASSRTASKSRRVYCA